MKLTPYYMTTAHLTTANPWTPLWLHLDYPDGQCAYGHSGIVCGRCKSNLSLAIGSLVPRLLPLFGMGRSLGTRLAIGTSQCLKCKNTHFTLLLPFATSCMHGLMLVLFLIVYNLTVSMEISNCLIFYAGIVRINHFPFCDDKDIFSEVFEEVVILTVI